MEVKIYTGGQSINHGPLGRAFTPLGGPSDVTAWQRSIDWLRAKSPRFEKMWSDILAYKLVREAWVVVADGVLSQGKFFTPEETKMGGWPGALAGKPVILIGLRGCVAVGLNVSNLKSYIGEKNADLFGATSWQSTGVMFGKIAVPNGWAYTPNKQKERQNGVQTPLMGVAHEVGHLWQWVTFKNDFNLCMDKALKGDNDFNLRLEIHNIIDNEAPIAHEMGEAIRFHYEYATTFSNDFAYKLPAYSPAATLPTIGKEASESRFVDWPKGGTPRKYGETQMGAALTKSGSTLIRLSVNKMVGPSDLMYT